MNPSSDPTPPQAGAPSPAVTQPAALQSGVPSVAPPFDGGCACGALRYRMHCAPMFVHCCHCTRCQRETGGPFAHHAMIEFSQLSLLAGEAQFVLVPTDSGNKHWVARCAQCRTAVWNEHGTRQAVTRYVRVGTLDDAALFAPQAHIFVRSKQAWLTLADGAKQYAGYYVTAKTWPAQSLARYAQAQALRAQERAEQRAAKAQLTSRSKPAARKKAQDSQE